jgi:hypothetical protein
MTTNPSMRPRREHDGLYGGSVRGGRSVRQGLSADSTTAGRGGGGGRGRFLEGVDEFDALGDLRGDAGIRGVPIDEPVTAGAHTDPKRVLVTAVAGDESPT